MGWTGSALDLNGYTCGLSVGVPDCLVSFDMLCVVMFIVLCCHDVLFATVVGGILVI